MKKIICYAFIIAASASFLQSCTNYGKSVNVEGTKTGIYYKDGATEGEAKKLGAFLKKDGFLADNKEATLQLLKETDKYVVRFVYDKGFYEKNAWVDSLFKIYGVRMSKELFGGKRTDIALADKYLKDFKTIPYDEATAKAMEQSREEVFNKNAYEHDSAGGVNFFWKDITSEESKRISDYIVKNGAFAGGQAEIYMSRQGQRYILSFPIKEEYRSNASYLAEAERVSREIKENVFSTTPYTFQVTDELMKPIKIFNY